MTFERNHAEASAYYHLNGEWEDAFGDFEEAMKDLTEELEAAVTDRWVEWRRERTNGVLHNRGAVSRDGAGDSGVGRSRPDPQQDVGERRVGELARVKEKRDV